VRSSARRRRRSHSPNEEILSIVLYRVMYPFLSPLLYHQWGPAAWPELL
jgi:hypothetical protein